MPRKHFWAGVTSPEVIIEAVSENESEIALGGRWVGREGQGPSSRKVCILQEKKEWKDRRRNRVRGESRLRRAEQAEEGLGVSAGQENQDLRSGRWEAATNIGKRRSLQKGAEAQCRGLKATRA